MKKLLKITYLIILACLSGCGSGGTDEAPPSSLPEECSGMTEGPPRGLSILHLSHPKARPQTERTLAVLDSLCARRIAIATLVDGSFGFDAPYLEEIIGRLSEKHELHMFFYLHNGSSQRRWENSKIQGLFTGIEPGSFRKRILWEERLRNQYRDGALKILDLTNNLLALGGHPYWTIGLEDNLDKKAVDAMESILRPVMPQGTTLVRSPCPGCYPGNNPDYRALKGEHHGDSLSFSSSSFVVSNDGYSDNIDKLVPVFDRAASYGGVFLYWNASWQGLHGRDYLAANDRSYAVPTLEQERKLKEFLSRN